MNKRIVISLSMCMILMVLAFMACDNKDISSFSQKPVRGEPSIPKPIEPTEPIPKPTGPAKLYLIGGYGGSGTRYKNDVWSSDDGITWTKEPNPPFKGRYDHQTIVFKNRIYVIGGRYIGTLEDIWSSSDGKEWKEETWKDGSASSYSSQFSLPYLSKLSIPQLQALKLTVEDVTKLKYSPHELKAADFQRFASYTAAAAKFLPRMEHSATVFRNTLYVIGGDSPKTFGNDDVWSSIDGITWVFEKLKPCGFCTTKKYIGKIMKTIQNHQAVVFQEKLWVIGGMSTDNSNTVFRGAGSILNHIWNSTNGSTWNEIKSTGRKFSRRFRHQVVVFKNKLWVIGGHSPLHAYQNDVWNSTDGSTWNEIKSTDRKFSARFGHRVVVFKNKLWLIGGGQGGQVKNDIWSSSDGKEWKEELPFVAVGKKELRFSRRAHHSVVVFP